MNFVDVVFAVTNIVYPEEMMIRRRRCFRCREPGSKVL